MNPDKVPLICDDHDADDENDFIPSLKSRRSKSLTRRYLILFIICLALVLFVVTASSRDFSILTFNGAKPEIFLSEPFFPNLELTKNLKCEKYFQKRTPSVKPRITISNQTEFATNLVVTCDEIRKRHYFPSQPLTPKEKEFPLAFARNVYGDYYFLEMELASIYAPQNFYCFAIDKKSSPLFHEQIHNLSQCLPNVFYSKKELALDSAGHNQNAAHYECVSLLQKYSWKYVILLQNHDVSLKTNAEMVQIFKWFNGANDISVNPLIKGRVNTKLDWSFKALNLFKNATRNTVSVNGFPPKLKFSKTLVEIALSRAMVDFIFKELNLDIMLKNFNGRGYGNDEYFWSSLQSTEAIEIPGGFTHKCLDEKIGTSAITRRTDWVFSKNHQCKSGLVRHSICVYGIEDLYRLQGNPFLFLNKMIPWMDFGAFYCLKQKIFNDTYGPESGSVVSNMSESIYSNLRHVRYHREKSKSGFQLKDFKCK